MLKFNPPWKGPPPNPLEILRALYTASGLEGEIWEELLEREGEWKGDVGELLRRGPIIMYHLTPRENWLRIKQVGLSPGRVGEFVGYGSDAQPSGNVVWLSEDFESVASFISEALDHKTPYRIWYVLRVEVPPGTYLAVDPYGDEEVMTGSWISVTPIPANQIRLIGWVELARGFSKIPPEGMKSYLPIVRERIISQGYKLSDDRIIFHWDIPTGNEIAGDSYLWEAHSRAWGNLFEEVGRRRIS